MFQYLNTYLLQCDPSCAGMFLYIVRNNLDKFLHVFAVCSSGRRKFEKEFTSITKEWMIKFNSQMQKNSLTLDISKHEWLLLFKLPPQCLKKFLFWTFYLDWIVSVFAKVRQSFSFLFISWVQVTGSMALDLCYSTSTYWKIFLANFTIGWVNILWTRLSSF